MAKLAEPKVGEMAPQFTLPNQHNTPIPLAQYHGHQQVILFFVRTPTCWQCREHVEQLVRQYDQFKRLDTEVLVVLNAHETEAQQYAAKVHAPFPVLADPGHSVYELYGLNKVFLLNTRTASVVIDKQGQISYIKSGVNVMTWIKEAQEVLEHVKALHAQTVG